MDLRSVRFFLLDMDGTLYLGERLLDGVVEFIEALRESGRGFLLFTNNSSRDAAGYAEKLNRLGITVPASQVITSGEATVEYLRGEAGCRKVFVLGTPSLEGEMVAGGLRLEAERPDAVVLGFDLTLTYDKVRRACHLIRKGIPFIATHPDLVCPAPGGPIPDCGAMAAMITAATGVSPKVIGKPHRYMVEAALMRMGATAGQTAIVGDRLYTDIEMGFSSGLKTILVLSGEAGEGELQQVERRPDLVLSSVAALTPLLNNSEPGEK